MQTFTIRLFRDGRSIAIDVTPRPITERQESHAGFEAALAVWDYFDSLPNTEMVTERPS